VRDEQVVRLQIAVDDPFLVGCREAIRNLERVINRFSLRQRGAIDSLAQRLAFEQL
jgi:hypothetical protein